MTSTASSGSTTALTDLVRGLTSRDAHERDSTAYGEFCTGVSEGRFDASERAAAAGLLVANLTHPEIQARTFAVLGLAALVEHGDWDDGWFDGARGWYLGEVDLRGFDPDLGWLHAVAHGADFFGACGARGRVPAQELLAVLGQRLVRPTDIVWRDLEEARVAHAISMVLSAPEVSSSEAVQWLDEIEAYLRSVVPGPIPAPLSNATRTLSCLFVALGQQLRDGGREVQVQHADLVRSRCLEVLEPVTPWFWRRSDWTPDDTAVRRG